MQEIYNQINELLKAKYPDQGDRDKIISTMGELIISETYVELLEAVKDEPLREKLVKAINEGNQDEVLSISDSLGLDLANMLEAKSKEVLAEATA